MTCSRALALSSDLPALSFSRSLPPNPMTPGLLATAMPRTLALHVGAVADARPCRQASSRADLLSIAHEAHDLLL